MKIQTFPFSGRMRKAELLPYFGGKQRIIDMFPPECLYGSKKRYRYVHVNNEAPILLVAHIDTVISPRLVKVNTGAGFDDRLGVYAAHKLLQAYPQWFDLLLADYEEEGKSTAGYFLPKHPYKLVIELDREGTGFVDYDLASDSLKKTLKAYGLEEHLGSFSDICFLWNVKCNMINVGLGIFNSHSPNSGFHIHDFQQQMKKLLFFLEDNHNVDWPEAEGESFYGWDQYRRAYSRSSYSYDDDAWMKCEWCGKYFSQDKLSVIDSSILCGECARYLYNEFDKEPESPKVKFLKCVYCDTWYTENEIYDFDGENICMDCLTDYQDEIDDLCGETDAKENK